MKMKSSKIVVLLMLVLSILIPTESFSNEVVVNAQSAGIINSAKSSRSSKDLTSEGGLASFTIRGDNLDPNTMLVRVYKNGVLDETVGNTFEFSSPMVGLISATVTLPANSTTSPQTYSFEFSCDGWATSFKNGNDADVTVAASAGADPETSTENPSETSVENPTETTVEEVPTPIGPTDAVYGLDKDLVELSSQAGNVSVKLYTDKATLNENIRATALLNGQPIDLTYEVNGVGAGRDIDFVIPANNTSDIQEYLIYFNTVGSESVVSTTHELKIRVEGKENTQSTISSVTTKNPLLPLSGGQLISQLKVKILTHHH